MDFDTWLSECLLNLKTDEAVFGPYIKSIVEGDEELDQKTEDLDGILSELGATSLSSAEIISKWNDHQTQCKSAQLEKAHAQQAILDDGSSSIDKQLEKLLTISTPEKGTNSTDGKGIETDTALRAAILSQYQEDDTESDDDGGGAPRKSSGSTMEGLEKNTNASSVLNAQKEFKEKQREDAAKKREKDREDRANQKKLAEEKKEKAKKKTAKVERKR